MTERWLDLPDSTRAAAHPTLGIVALLLSAHQAVALAVSDWDPLANFRAGYDPWAAIWNMMWALFGVLCIAMGVRLALGIWFSRLRGRWGRRGNGPPTGSVTCAGIAIAVVVFGLLVLSRVLSYPAPPLYRNLGGLCLFAGFALIGVGHGLDMGASPNPRDHGFFRWTFAIFFVLMLIGAGTAMLFSPG